MKTCRITILLLIVTIVFATGCRERKAITEAELSESIRINQLGVYPGLEKQFTLNDTAADAFRVVGNNGKVAFRGDLQQEGFWEPSGEFLMSGDFSELHKKGTYFIYVPGVGRSHPFVISDSLYHSAARAALKSYYFMRTGIDIEEEYVGKFSRPAGHPDDTCYYHPSTGRSGGFRSSPGGWYDAGDYGKYVVNAGVSVGTMLNLHEWIPDAFADGSLDIPESGNGISDLLDEMRYELDWVMTMQDEDGGVFHKLTPLLFDGVTMPHETRSKRFFIGKSTAATLNLAAIMAQASRIYRDVDPRFSKQALSAAEKAYKWAVEHPGEYFRNPEGVNTGGYGDRILDEEFFWAAAELYCTTGSLAYYDAIRGDLGNIRFRLEESWRNTVDNLGYYSLLMCERITGEDREILEQGLLKLADELAGLAASSPYGIPVSRFVWGSNSDVLNTAVVLLFAYRVNGDSKYLEAAAGIADYIFGRNATGYSFVSGYGAKYSRNFHHRLLMADDLDEPFPGFVAGGPNHHMQDRMNVRQGGADYPSTLPARAYIDHEGSYASNEVCINWNAPLVFVLGALEHLQ
ncbi:MAG: glycoside hydrolase family 9 protein [Bacteroidales bacterium]|nr:glycoside hydrolase family 9 protein [Bacteroidales bacterium]MBN2699099.1 glycoside hydrolase family 9 protein [Bacteroidales bacterium]